MKDAQSTSTPEEAANESTHTRRTFCIHSCQALSVATFAGAFTSLLQGCNGFTYPTPIEALPTINAAPGAGSAVVTVDTSSPLAAIGGAAIVQSTSGPLLVVRTSDTEFSALSGMCTHRTCSITGYAKQIFTCPCHGSEFDITGKVVNGPATIPLRQYATQFANGVLTITL